MVSVGAPNTEGKQRPGWGSWRHHLGAQAHPGRLQIPPGLCFLMRTMGMVHGHLFLPAPGTEPGTRQAVGVCGGMMRTPEGRGRSQCGSHKGPGDCGRVMGAQGLNWTRPGTRPGPPQRLAKSGENNRHTREDFTPLPLRHLTDLGTERHGKNLKDEPASLKSQHELTVQSARESPPLGDRGRDSLCGQGTPAWLVRVHCPAPAP